MTTTENDTEARRKLIADTEAMETAAGGGVIRRKLGVAPSSATRALTIRPTPREDIEPRTTRTRQAVAMVGTVVHSPPVAATGHKVRDWGRALLRVLWTIGAGFKAWCTDILDALNYKTHKSTIAALQQTGQHDASTRALDSLTKAKADRRAHLLSLPKQVLMAGAVGGLIVGLVLLVNFLISIAVQITPNDSPECASPDPAVVATCPDWNFVTWWAFVFDVVQWVAWAVQWAAIIGAWTAAPVLLIWAFRKGKRSLNAPKFLLNAKDAAMLGAEITPHKAVVALRDLGIGPLRKAIEIMMATDTAAGMLSPVRTAGCGTEWDARLTSGVSTEEVLKRRRKMAENLDRHEHELFMSIPAARTVRFWAADPGELDKPLGPSPLVLDPTLKADVYTGRAPWGQTMRGDAAAVSLHQRHGLYTGLSNQGKTAACRALALWWVLDVTTEIRIADLKGIGDWHMFGGVATVLIEGPADEHVIAATEMLESVVAEMERRLGALDKDEYPNGVTRDLARRKGSGFHPLKAIVDEAQVAFMCPAVGEDKRPYGGTKATSRFFNAARKILNQGRAVNVTLDLGTQDPTNDNLPKLIREACHIRGCLPIGTEEQARMAIGAKAVDGGGAPHKLRAGIDKGVLVMNGEGFELEPGQLFVNVRTHFIDGDDATDITRRAVELREKAGRMPTPPDGGTPAAAEDEVDFLADVSEVMDGEERVTTTTLLKLLAQENPTRYGGATFDSRALTAALKAEGIEARKLSGGRMYVLADQVDAAFRRRDDAA